jgi:hypothetical protein
MTTNIRVAACVGIAALISFSARSGDATPATQPAIGESAVSSKSDGVAFPEGYRSWTHVSSAHNTAGPRGPGMHHIYANAKAMEGYRTGRFPDGAIIVFDRFGLQVCGSTSTIGKRQMVDIMVRDSARYRETGGWAFDEFVGDSRTQHAFTPAQSVTTCFNCHTQRKDSAYVFTSFSDKDRIAK